MNYWHLITIGVSLCVLFLSFWATYKTAKPWNFIAAIVAPASLVSTIIGVLLLCVPDFFSVP